MKTLMLRHLMFITLQEYVIVYRSTFLFVTIEEYVKLVPRWLTLLIVYLESRGLNKYLSLAIRFH